MYNCTQQCISKFGTLALPHNPKNHNNHIEYTDLKPLCEKICSSLKINMAMKFILRVSYSQEKHGNVLAEQYSFGGWLDGWNKIMAKSNSTSVIFSQNIVYTHSTYATHTVWDEKNIGNTRLT